MAKLDLSKVKQVLPDYDELPNVLSPEATVKALGGVVELNTLAVWRSTGRGTLGYVRVGRRIAYPKSEIARFLLASAVGVGAE